MKRIIKKLEDLEFGDIFTLEDESEFRVINQGDEFKAICIKCKNDGFIDKLLIAPLMSGLGLGFMASINKERIIKVVDINGKEVEINEDKSEIKDDQLNSMLEGLKLTMDLDENPNDLELIEKAQEFAKRETLRLLKDDKIDLEKKKELMEVYKDLENTYNEIKENNKNDNSEVENFINELEEK